MFQFSLSNLNDAKIFYDIFFNYVKGLKQKPVFLCVGTNKIKNDCFGPNMGSILKKNFRFFVYGSLKREVNGLNFVEVFNFIKKKHENAPVIVIDNVLIKNSNNIKLIFKNEGIFPRGLSNNKHLIGDASLLINGFEYNNCDNFKDLYKIIFLAIKKLNILFWIIFYLCYN